MKKILVPFFFALFAFGSAAFINGDPLLYNESGTDLKGSDTTGQIQGSIPNLIQPSVSPKALTTDTGRTLLPRAATETVKVIVVIEDPVINGKHFHELGHWNDPRTQYPRVKETLEKCSGGVVKYDIVKVIESDSLFTYFKENEGSAGRHFTKQQLKQYFIDDPKWPVIRAHEKNGTISYDYLSMVKYFGFDDMRDKNQVQEIWVCSFPVNGMYESNFVSQKGKGFWLNSPPTAGGSNKLLLTVMYYNYERGIAEAIHSNGHRMESVMRHVYGRWASVPPGKRYKPGMELNNWEKYTLYDAIAPGNGNLGCIHYPVNAVHDYDYMNPAKVITYRKAWKYYPDIQPGDSDKEIVDGSTWRAMGNGDNQLGCMINFFSYLPNKKGINPADGKLNNWWHYMVNYEDAVELQEKLYSAH